MQVPAYRSAPTSPSLISWCGGTLLAIDPTTGALRWERKLDLHLARLLLTDRVVAFAARGGSPSPTAAIYLFDLATGADRGRVDVGFDVTAAMRHGELLLFCGSAGILALRADGSFAWRVAGEVVASSAWSGDTHDLVGRDGSGVERWRLPQRSMIRDGALAIEDQVAQPDITG